MQKLFGWLKHLNLDGWIKWGAAALVFVVPLYQKFPLLSVRGTFVAVRLEDFLLLGVALISLLYLIPRWKMVVKDKLILVIGLFLAISLTSVVSGVFLTKTISLSIGVLHLIRRVEYMIGFVIGFLALGKKKNLSFYLECLGLVIFIAFIYGLGQKYLSWPVIMTQNQEYSKGVALRYTPGAHLISTFAGHYDLATFLILVSPIFLGFLVNTPALAELGVAKKMLFSRLLMVLVTFGAIWLLINSASRISIVSFVLSASIVFFLTRKYWAIPVLAIAMAIWVAFSGNLLVRYDRVFEVGIEQVKQRIKINYVLPRIEVLAQEEKPAAGGLPQVLAATEDRSTNIRLNVEWPRAIRAFTKNPLLGTGFSSITLATDNDYLRLLGEVGILGFLAFILILVRLVIELIKALPMPKRIGVNQIFAAAMMGALPGVLLNAVFIDVFEASKFAIMFWLLMGMVVGVVREGKNG